MNLRNSIISLTDCTRRGHGCVYPRRLSLLLHLRISILLPQTAKERSINLIRAVSQYQAGMYHDDSREAKQ